MEIPVGESIKENYQPKTPTKSGPLEGAGPTAQQEPDVAYATVSCAKTPLMHDGDHQNTLIYIS